MNRLCLLFFFPAVFFLLPEKAVTVQPLGILSAADTTKIDREYALEASMLGYFAKDGSRNPTLKANKGDRVRITITNGELMTHDIALEKLGIKSKTIQEKGTRASITFTADKSDTYYCTVPGHRAAGMVGSFEVVEGDVNKKTVAGQVPLTQRETAKPEF